MEHTASRRALIALDGFAGLSAVAGMVGLVGGGVQMPAAWLEGTPFADYLVPGLILGIAVGGSALLAIVATIWNAGTGAVLSLIAGAIMMGWIVGEYILMPNARFGLAVLDASWLQPLYFLVGLAMAALALRILPGGWRSLPHAARLT